MALPVLFGSLDQGVDLAGRQVLAGPKRGVRATCREWSDPGRNIINCS
jgi:hypothetical protein